MSYFVVFIFMLMLGVDLSYLFKRGFGQTAAFSNFILIFMLYLGGLFLDMRTAMYVFLSAVILLTAYVGYKAIRHKDVAGVKTIFSNPVFYFYAVTGIMLGIIFLNNVSCEFDEMTHWAISVKNMLAFDNFGNVGNTTTMFNQYVPASGIFGYAFQIFGYAFQIFGREFINGHLFATMDLLIMSMILPVAEMFSKKISISAIISFVIAFLVPVFFKYNIFCALQVDAMMGVAIGYIYLSYKVDNGRTDGFTIVNISLACFVLTLVKSAGIAHAIFALLFVAVDALTRRKEQLKEFFADRMNFAYILLPVVLMAFAKLSWSWYVDFYGVRAGWNTSEMTFANIIAWLQNPNPFQIAVTKNFFKTFFIADFAYINNTCLQQPQLFFILAVIAVCVILGFKTKNKRFAIAQCVTMLIVIFGYALSLLLMYLFSFSYGEGLGLSEYSRYTGTIYIGLSLILYYQLAELVMVPIEQRTSFEDAPQNRFVLRTAVASVSIILVVVFTAVGFVTCTKTGNRRYSDYSEWLSSVQTLDSKTDSVYIVVNDTEKNIWQFLETYLSMRFFATPMQTSGYLEGGSYENGRDSDTSWTGNPFSSDMSVEQLSDEMSKYTHVYLHDVWNEFEDKYADLFADEIKDDTLYEITVDSGGNIKLVLAS